MKPGQIYCANCKTPTFSAWCPTCLQKEWAKRDKLQARVKELEAEMARLREDRDFWHYNWQQSKVNHQEFEKALKREGTRAALEGDPNE